MTVEEAVRELNVIKYCEVDGRKQIEAIDIAVAALQEEKIGGPLTLEQLRGMDGQPVFCEWLLPEDRAAENGKWFIVTIGDKTGLEIKRPADYGNYFLKTEDYGKTWLAYAYPPAHIDREAWTAEWKEYTGADAGFHYCSKCGQQAFNYEDGGETVEVLSDFCPSCGRPTTPKGLAELEKRMGLA